MQLTLWSRRHCPSATASKLHTNFPSLLAQFHEMEGRIEAQRVVTSTVQALAELQRPIADAEKAVDKANAEKDVQQHVFDKAKHHFDALDKELEAKKCVCSAVDV